MSDKSNCESPRGTQGQLKGKDSSGGNIVQPPENNPPTLKKAVMRY